MLTPLSLSRRSREKQIQRMLGLAGNRRQEKLAIRAAARPFTLPTVQTRTPKPRQETMQGIGHFATTPVMPVYRRSRRQIPDHERPSTVATAVGPVVLRGAIDPYVSKYGT